MLLSINTRKGTLIIPQQFLRKPKVNLLRVSWKFITLEMHFAVTECSIFFIKKCTTSVLIASSKYNLGIDTKFIVKSVKFMEGKLIFWHFQKKLIGKPTKYHRDLSLDRLEISTF